MSYQHDIFNLRAEVAALRKVVDKQTDLLAALARAVDVTTDSLLALQRETRAMRSPEHVDPPP